MLVSATLVVLATVALPDEPSGWCEMPSASAAGRPAAFKDGPDAPPQLCYGLHCADWSMPLPGVTATQDDGAPLAAATVAFAVLMAGDPIGGEHDGLVLWIFDHRLERIFDHRLERPPRR